MSLPERELVRKQGELGPAAGDCKPEARAERGMEFISMLKKGVEYTQELLGENEKLKKTAMLLREQNLSLQQKIKSMGQGPDMEAVRRKLAEQEAVIANLEKRAVELETENKEFANRYVEIEEHGNMLTNLYIASRQLHSSLNFDEVMRSVIEIIINLIGAERFAVMLLDEKTRILKAVASEGMEPEEVPPVKAGDGVIGGALVSGQAYYRTGSPGDDEGVLVCLPLRIGDRAVGAIAIYSLLQQKERLTELDHELFALLGEQTAMALLSSRLYGESERKLSTIQGFIGLITK